MFKVLLQKQLIQFKYSYFRDRKTGKLKKGASAVGTTVLYVFIFLSLAFSFFGISMGVRLYVSSKEDVWIMFTIMSFITIFASTFLNMLITRGILFEAKDNELLLSLPIKDSYIIASRMLNVFLNSIIYTAIMWLPVVLNSLIYDGFDVLVLIYGIILFVVITIMVVGLSCLFGYILSLLMKKSKKKNLSQTIITLLLLGLYYVVYFNANRIMTSLLADLNKFEAAMKTKGIVLYAIAKAAAGNTMYLLLAIVLCVGIGALCFVVILSKYRKLLIATPSQTKKEFKGKYSKQSSIQNTLLNRELRHFLSNSTYTINCGLGIVILVGAIIAILIFRSTISELMEVIKIIPMIKDGYPIVIMMSILLLASMDALAVPAVSLEGKNYWIVRSLPVSTYDVLNAKRLLQFRLHIVPIAILSVLCTFVFEISDINQVLFVLTCLIGYIFITYFDLFLGIKGANLKWADETVVIKQSGNVAIAIFGGMILFGGLGVGYLLLICKYIDLSLFMLILLIVFSFGSTLIDRWIRNKGVKEFETLK